MNVSLPPTSAVSDALALVRLAQNPEAVAKNIEALNEASERHAAVLQEASLKHQTLDGREQDLVAREDALNTDQQAVLDRLADIEAREAQVTERHAYLVEEQRTHDLAAAQLEKDQAALDADRQTVAALRLNHEQVFASRETALQEAEAQLASDVAAHEARVARVAEAMK